MGQIVKTPNERRVFNEVMSKRGYIHLQSWTAPAIADNISIHAAVVLNAAAATIAATDRVFVISSGAATVGAVYSNNGQTFTVKYTIAAKTQLICSASGAPAASGTLTKISGTGDTTITFSAANTFAQPDFPRAIRLKASAVGDNGLVVTYNGTNIRDQAITEDVTITAYGTAQDSTKAFKTITSIVLPAEAGASNISFGVGLALGLDRLMPGNTTIMSLVNGVADTTLPTQVASSTVISNNTIVTATAPGSSRNFLIASVCNEIALNGNTTV